MTCSSSAKSFARGCEMTGRSSLSNPKTKPGITIIGNYAACARRAAPSVGHDADVFTLAAKPSAPPMKRELGRRLGTVSFADFC
jgi:hypothetical protein